MAREAGGAQQTALRSARPPARVTCGAGGAALPEGRSAPDTLRTTLFSRGGVGDFNVSKVSTFPLKW